MTEGPIYDQQYITVAVKLNSYQLVNLLKALSYVPDNGDWYHEVIGRFDIALQGEGFYLDSDLFMTSEQHKAYQEWADARGLRPFKLDYANPMTTEDVKSKLQMLENK